MAYTGIRPGRSQGKMKAYGNPNNLAGSAATGYRATGNVSAPTAPVKPVQPGGALSQFAMPEAANGPSVGRQVAAVAGTKILSDLAGKGAGQLYDAGAKYVTDAWGGDGNDTSFASAPALPQSAAADYAGSGAQAFEVTDYGAGVEEVPMAENFGDDVGAFSSYEAPAADYGSEVLDTSAVTADDGSWMDIFEFANGGMVPGHSEGVDDVPIMADGGEMMIPTDVVDQLGPEFFDTLIKAFHKPIPGKPPTRTALSGMSAGPGDMMANGGAISKMHASDDYPSPVKFGRR